MTLNISWNATADWHQALMQIFHMGADVSPRGYLTKELIAVQSTIYMEQPIITSPGRQLGYRFMFAEAAWILSGDDKVETIAPYSKDISNFSDDGVTFFGAYGPKISDQIEYVVKTLVEDPTTRQAVINIWRENPPKTKDVPCTLSLQFIIRNGYLNCVATMRSSDIWLGHPYDIFNFSALSTAVAIYLREEGMGVKLGLLHLNAGSKHLYHRNFEAVQKVISTEIGAKMAPGFRLDPQNYQSVNEFRDYLWWVANENSEHARVIACQG